MPLILQLGSNLGEREIYLARARVAIEKTLGPILKQSSIYETAPWRVVNQAHFLNQVIIIQTEKAPLECLHRCQEIEASLGRKRDIKWGARTIDIDLLFQDDHRVESEELTLPHPFIQDRRFVLLPLCEVAGDVTHPVLGKTSLELMDNCTDEGEVLRYLRTSK